MTKKQEEFTVTYSNKEVIDEIKKLSNKIDNFDTKNEEQHKSIENQTKYTNGKVRFLTKAMWAGAGIIFTILFYLIQLHIQAPI